MQNLYYGGPILTMEQTIYTQSVLTEDGIIKALGSLEDLKKICSSDCNKVDLGGKTLMPAFIDSHSHITAVAEVLSMADLSTAESIGDICSTLKAFKEKNSLPVIIAFGYDNNNLKEHRHPNKFDLDIAINDVPVIISHRSGHMGVVNSKALEMLGITSNTKDPNGGKIGRELDGVTPDGYLEEKAFTAIKNQMPPLSGEEKSSALIKAENEYIANGYLTIQEGKCQESQWELLKFMSKNNLLTADVIAYVDISTSADIAEKNKEYKNYVNHLKIGGYKLFLDGSPQGKTAWLTRPYEGEDYSGYGVFSDEEVYGFIEKAYSEQTQIIIHANGDRAIDQLIICAEKIGKKLSEIRPVLIHGQLARKDQLEKLADLGIMVSFFAAHTYHWGDVHMKNLGIDRAAAISPLNSAINAGVVITLHQDSPVIEPNVWETIWCAVNRQTKSGIVIGQEEQISPLAALKAVTINAAYQNFEESTKGSISAGKKAQFIIIDKNPLQCPHDKIKDIKITGIVNY